MGDVAGGVVHSGCWVVCEMVKLPLSLKPKDTVMQRDGSSSSSGATCLFLACQAIRGACASCICVPIAFTALQHGVVAQLALVTMRHGMADWESVHWQLGNLALLAEGAKRQGHSLDPKLLRKFLFLKSVVFAHAQGFVS